MIRMVQPLTAFAVSFSLGIAAGRCLMLPVWALFFATGLFFIASWRFIARGRVFGILALGLVFCLGAADQRIAALSRLPQTLSCGPVLVKGSIVSDPLFLKRTARFSLKVLEAAKNGQRVEAAVVISVVSHAKRAWRYGDDVLLEGSFTKMKGGLVFVVKKNGISETLKARRANFIVGKVFDVKSRARETIRAHLEYPFSDILIAMLLGDAAYVPAGLKDAMLKTGTWHLMVVSGSHTALLAFVLLMVLKVARFPRRLRIFLVIFALLAYSVMTGGTSPVVRATVMALAFLVSFLLERPTDFLNSISLAALAILIFDPEQLFNIGFQLSFLSVFFIFWLYPKIRAIFPERLLRRRPAGWLITGFCVCFSAWLGTSPLLIYAFGRFSCVAVLANMAAAPFSTLLVASGLVFLFLSAVAPFLAPLAARACEASIALLVRTCVATSAFPYASVDIAPMPFIVVLLLYALIFWLARSLPSVRDPA